MIKLLNTKRLSAKAQKYIDQFVPQLEPVLPSKKRIIQVCWPAIGKQEEKLLIKAVRSSWLSSHGSYVAKFEEQFAKFCQTSHAIAVTNGTHALQLILAGLGISKGDEVIVPTFTMIATANAVSYCMATPIFVDARLDTWNIDEKKIEAAITPRTKAIVVVHIYGHPCEMDTILHIARKYKLPVIEDAAEAHGSMYKGKKAGSLADAASFSFYSNKMITTGEGGMVTTSHQELYALLNQLHNHAFSEKIHFWHTYLGYNFRMTNLQAAVGVAQLRKIRRFINARQKNATTYRKLLGHIPGIIFQTELTEVVSSQWMVGIRVTKEFPVCRDELRTILAKKGIETRSFFIPLHLQPIYWKDCHIGAFPVSEQLCAEGLYLPSAATLSKKQLHYIANSIINIYEKHKSNVLG